MTNESCFVSLPFPLCCDFLYFSCGRRCKLPISRLMRIADCRPMLLMKHIVKLYSCRTNSSVCHQTVYSLVNYTTSFCKCCIIKLNKLQIPVRYSVDYSSRAFFSFVGIVNYFTKIVKSYSYLRSASSLCSNIALAGGFYKHCLSCWKPLKLNFRANLNNSRCSRKIA